MCGIAGWCAFGDQRLPARVVQAMLLRLEERGWSASGIAWAERFGDEKFHCCKHHIRGGDLLKMKVYEGQQEAIAAAQLCIMHTRAPTKGSPDDNRNNHPVYRTGGRYVAVHNGLISNDDWNFESLGVEREAEVDSEAIVARLDSGKDSASSRAAAEKLTGTYAIAAFPQENVDHLILIRNSCPIWTVFDSALEIFLFASTPAVLAQAYVGRDSTAAKKYKIQQSSMGLPAEMKDDSFMILTKDGIESSGRHVIDHSWRQSRWDDEVGSHGRAYKTPPLMAGGPAIIRTGEDFRPFAGEGAGREGEGVLAPPCPLASSTAGTWSGRQLTLYQSEGMCSPDGPGLKEGMLSFPAYKFPEFAGEALNADVTIECPACWTYVSARMISSQNMTCPNCKTPVEALNKRTLTAQERGSYHPSHGAV